MSNLPDLLLSALACEGGRGVILEKILTAMAEPTYLEAWTHKLSIEIFIHLVLVVVDDGEGFECLYKIMLALIDNCTFEFIVDEAELNSDSMADLVDKVGEVLDKPYALFYAMFFRILAHGILPAAFFRKEHRLDHVGVIMALSQSCSSEAEEHALSAIFNFGVRSEALPLIVERDHGYLVRLAKIVIEGTRLGKILALSMLAQLVYKNMDRKKLLSSRPLKLIPYLIQLLKTHNDTEIRDKAIKLISGLAEVPENRTEFVSATGSLYILSDLFNILDEDYSETRDFAILILWCLAKEHKANLELFLAPQFRLVPQLIKILQVPNESIRNALGLISLLFENPQLAERLLSNEDLLPLILSIAANEPQDSIRANAMIIISKMSESSSWKQFLVSQGDELLDNLLAIALSEELKVSRGFAVRSLYSLANEFPIVAKYCFKSIDKFLELMARDESVSKFKVLQFLGSVLGNEDNQRIIQYEAQSKNSTTCLLNRIIATVLSTVESAQSAENRTPLDPANANLIAMTKSVAFDVIRALSDKNSAMQQLLFHSELQLMEVLGRFLDQPEPINGNHDPKVVVLIVLYNIAGNEDLKSEFVDPKYGLISRILRIIMLAPANENTRAKSFAAGTICRLVSRHTDNQMLFANPSLGVLPILIASIRHPDNSWKAKEFAVGALVHIAKLPANHWVAFDPDLALFSTAFELLKEVKRNEIMISSSSSSSGKNKKTNNDEIRFYVLGVIEDLLEAYDRPDGSQLEPNQREALLNELLDIGSEAIVSATKAKAIRLLLVLSVDTGYVLNIQSQRLDLVQILVSFLNQLCEPLSTAVSAQNLGEKDRRTYLNCIGQFTTNKRVKTITSFLTRDSLHLLPILYRFLSLSTTSKGEELLASTILWNMAENGEQSVSIEFVRHNIHVLALDILQETIKQRLEMDEYRTQLLNMLMNMARHFSVRESLKAAGAVEVAEKLLNYHHRENSFNNSMFGAFDSSRTNTEDGTVTSSNAQNSAGASVNRNNNPTNSLKALLMLLFLFGNEEAKDASMTSPKAVSIAQQVVTTDRLKTLIDIFSLTLQCRGGKDFFLGTFCLPLIVDACLVISQSDSNKAALVALGVVPLLTKVLVMYVNNECAIPNCGGGGNDEETAMLSIETLTHLSFSFGTNNAEMQEAFLKSNTLLLEILPALQERSQLPLESKNKAVILQYRLTIREGRGLPIARSINGSVDMSYSRTPQNLEHLSISGNNNDSSVADVRRISMIDTSVLAHSDPQLVDATGNQIKIVTPKHVMLSYCWDPTAHPAYVKKLAQELRRLGYDVWRDEDGSSLLPAVSGAVDDRLAEAIEKSDTVVICVSAAYKRSSSCRLEATYAHALARRNKVKLVFVMMNEHYTTISSPNHCDGWLGFMIGDNLWYSMWHENRTNAVATEIAKSLPEETKLCNREKSPSLLQSSLSHHQSLSFYDGSNSFPSASDGSTPADQAQHQQSSFNLYNKSVSKLFPAVGTANSQSLHNNNAPTSAFSQHENPMFGQVRRVSINSSIPNAAALGRSGMRDPSEVGDEEVESVAAFSMDDIYSGSTDGVNSSPAAHSPNQPDMDVAEGPPFAARSLVSKSAIGRQSSVLSNPHRESFPYQNCHNNMNISNNQNTPNNVNLYSNNNQGTSSSMTSNPLAVRRHSTTTSISRESSIPLSATVIRSHDDPSAFIRNGNVLFTPTSSVACTIQVEGAQNGHRASNNNATTSTTTTTSGQSTSHGVSSGIGFGPNVALSPAPSFQSELTLNSVHLPHAQSHQASTSSMSHNTAPEDTMTEITSEEDALSNAWRVLHCVELIKDPEGLEEYLQEEGIKSVDLLRYCDPEDWHHIASFLRNKPRKRFLELMHQWYQISGGNTNHELLATSLHHSAPSSRAPPLPPAHVMRKDHSSSSSVDNDDFVTDGASAYRIGLPSAAASARKKYVEDDFPEAPTGNIMCSLPELCVIS
jgi:hypothetical protein